MRVYLLLGGLFSIDGYVTSPGMLQLRGMVQENIPGTTFNAYLWGDFLKCHRDLMEHQNDKLAVIGYSGGGHKATWIANGYYGDVRNYLGKPRIDLMVLYDPSPTWSMMQIGNNVKRAICYENLTPWMLGLGGGVLKGPNVTTIPIRMQHLAVQASGTLHRQTLSRIKELGAQ
ncbi:MAG TPA: hypothetical protein VNN25_20915 [Thermoanaerobaculia bacterium]|nr:hypothetical protein [Thermoanaerobaculia bacterium]